MDFSKLQYKSSTVKDLKKQGINIEHPEIISPHGFYIVPAGFGTAPTTTSPSPTTTSPTPTIASQAPPTYSSLGFSDLGKRFANVTVKDIISDIHLNLPQARTLHRKPSHEQPASTFPRARVTVDFLTDDVGELNIRSGQTLDILKDLGDGWLTARRPDGTIGIVPKTFTVAI